MSFFSKMKSVAHGAETRYDRLIHQLSDEIRANGAESARAKWIEAEIQELTTKPAPHPFAKQSATPTPQRIKAHLRSKWYHAFQAPSDRQSRTPRSERRARAREMAKQQFKQQFQQQFQHGAQPRDSA